MNSFSDFKIDTNILMGDKIKMEDILNVNIEVHAFKIVPFSAKVLKSGKCLRFT